LNWLGSPAKSRILWLSGIPGSGKTFLAALIIDHLQTHFTPPVVGIAYLFCDYKDTTQTSERLKRAILRQLLHQLDDLPAEIDRLYETHARRSTEPSSSEIDDLLLMTASRFSQIFIVIDALDELSGIDGVSESVLKLCKELGSNTHALITSRWTGELRHHILQATSIEISARDQDITTYVHHELLTRKRLHLFVQKEPTFEAEAINTILGQCEGMFLVARLHIESLAGKPHLRAAKLALKQLPSTLDGVYNNALDRMKSQTEEDVALAWRVIAWIVQAKSPLTTQQLQHALAVEPECDHLDDDALIDMDLILSVCAGLVVLDTHSSTIRLVHFTAQEFFEKHAQKLIPEADCDIARVCLRYLFFDETAYMSLTDRDLSAKLESFPLLEYAAEHWGTHVSQCSGRDCELDDAVETFFSDEARVSGAVQIMLLPTLRHEGFSQNIRENVQPLHLAAHFGLLRTVKRLLRTEATDRRDTAGRTPLHWAARKGHFQVAKLLLENGAEVDALDNVNATSLHLACRYGHHDFVSVLIDHGSNVNATNNVGGTALIWAAICGSEKTASLLLKHRADVHSTTKKGSTALHKAVDENSEAVVRLLIQHGADVNALEDDGWRSPLHAATANSNEVIMCALLEASALPDIQISCGVAKTAIASAIRARTDGPLRLLLQFGADPNRRDQRGQTPVHYAARYGNLATLSALVPFSSLSVVDDLGETVLHHAINPKNERNDGEVVRLLLSTQRVDIEARDVDGWTPLMRSKHLGLEKITQLLLDADAKA
jgi:ankyrin repeat protein